MKKTILTAAAAVLFTLPVSLQAQDSVRYTGNMRVNIDYPHGQLPSVMGVHNIQTMRANKEQPELADGFGWAYNHAAMIAYWNDTFYINYLSDPDGEHYPPGQTLLQTSKDGYRWSRPKVLFPIYKLPDGIKQEGREEVTKDMHAVMHQRMGFYVSPKTGKLLTLGYYGICVVPKDNPNDGQGVGRVVREIYPDGTFGPIYFIRYNHGWNEQNTSYPFYKQSKDAEFVAACDELMADPMMTMQWVEESDRNDEVIPFKRPFKAFCYYVLPDGRDVALWKGGMTAFSSDSGRTWTEPYKIPGIITGTAKSWGQRTSDGKYAMVYIPSVFRWPMAVSVRDGGLNYKTLACVHGDVSPMRYTGNEKSYGPQYLRGIMPGNGTVPDNNMWLTYSVNKEDIWVMRVTVPILDKATEEVNENLSKYTKVSELDRWNIYSPLWAPVAIEKAPNGQNALALSDRDPYDYAKVERLFPEASRFTVEYSIIPAQNNTGLLNVELQDDKSSAAVRVCFDPDGMIRVKRGAKYGNVMPYKAGEKYDIKLDVDAKNYRYTVYVNGEKKTTQGFYAPVPSFTKIVFRTGETNKNLHPDRSAYENFVLEKAGYPVDKASYYLLSLKTSK